MTSALPARRLFTIDEYDRMGAAGILREDERVELLDGEILCMAPIGSRHAQCVSRLGRWLTKQLPDTADVRVQNPIRLPPYAEPEPDLAIVRHRDDDYGTAHPGPDDVLFLIEVADTTLPYDRGPKLRSYAEAGIPEVWIVDLTGDSISVYRSPRGGSFAEAITIERGGVLSPAAFPNLVLSPDKLLA